MGTALSLLVVMTVLLFAVRVAAVALRLTGLGESTARFQALSAISGVGSTTKESESIVNYPVRYWYRLVAWCHGLALVPDVKQESRSDYVRPDRQNSHLQDAARQAKFQSHRADWRRFQCG